MPTRQAHQAEDHTEHTKKTDTVENAVKLLGETVVPGASLMMDGNILSGGLHTLVGLWARTALGPMGLAVVIANSFVKSNTGKGLLGQISDRTNHRAETKQQDKQSKARA